MIVPAQVVGFPLYPTRRAGQVAEHLDYIAKHDRPPLEYGMGKDILELALVGNDQAFAYVNAPDELDSDGLESWCMAGAPWIWDVMEFGW